MGVEFEGCQLFAASPLGADGRDHLRLILVDQIEAWLRGCTADAGDDAPEAMTARIVDRCALVPITLDDSPAVAWRVASDPGDDGDARVRIEKTIRYSGNERLFGLSPRTGLPPAPRAVLASATLRFVASAPWDDFAQVRDAIEAAEQRVRHFLCWQHLDVADVNRDLPAIAAERVDAWRSGRQPHPATIVRGEHPRLAVVRARN